MLKRFQQGLADIDAHNLRRRRRLTESPCDTIVQVENRPMLAFCSNDYLGLAAHPHITAALQQGAAIYGAGSGASHLISGHSVAHHQLETRLAALLSPHIIDAQALYFCTGYMANIAVLSGLAAIDVAGSEIFSESLNHASLIDGAKLARCALSVYPHADLIALEALLQASTATNKIVVTDSVFSMDGIIAPLPQLLALCERYNAWLVVDDAHGFGVLGADGAGVLQHFNLQSPHLIYVGTLGKAAGVGGAFVAANHDIIEWLIQKARPYIFTTAAAPALAHALLASLDIITGAEGRQRRAHLAQLIDQFKKGVGTEIAGLRLLPSNTQIQPLIVGDNKSAMHHAATLWQSGIWISAIRPPTVPKNTARLRITLTASHTSQQVAQLLAALQNLQQGQTQ